MRKLVTNIVPEHILRKAQSRALKTYAKVIEQTYGPYGGYTTYSKTQVDNKSMAVSYYSKDGLTILKNVEVDQPIEALLKDELIDICANVVKVIGDGTSSAVLLADKIFEGMNNLRAEGSKKRDIIKAFKELVEEMAERITANGRTATLEDIYNIALTSTNGNEDMAEIIYNIYQEYGMDVWIDAQASSGPETVVKGYDGMVYDSGYLDPCFINNEDNHSCDLYNPHIYIFESPIDTPEMIKLFSLIIQKEINEPLARLQEMQKAGAPIREGYQLSDVVIICPFISRDANAYLDRLITAFTQSTPENRFHLCIVADMNDDPTKLIDIMKLTGAKFIKKYIDPAQYEADKKTGFAPTSKNIKTFYGTAEKIIIDSVSTRIINPAKMRDEKGKLTLFFTNYVAELKDILAKKEETREDIVNITKLRRRINNILGNMVDLYIGGIGTSDRRSLFDFVEDAVLNCRSAAQEGVGFGASFEALKVANEMLKHYESIVSDEDSDYMKTKKMMMGVIISSYFSLEQLLYRDVYENNVDTIKHIIESISTEDNQMRGPLNIITGEYDGKVLTSIRTETAILESLSKIITIIFDTNQYLVPTPQFNVYTENEDEDIIVVAPPIKKEIEIGEGMKSIMDENVLNKSKKRKLSDVIKDLNNKGKILKPKTEEHEEEIEIEEELEEKKVRRHVDDGPPFTSDVNPNHPLPPDPNTPKEPVEEDNAQPTEEVLETNEYLKSKGMLVEINGKDI